MKILFIGDIFGSPGRRAVSTLLPTLIDSHGPFDFIIVNGENAAGGKGLTRTIVNEFFELGANGITTGNHVWGKRELFDFIDDVPNLIRPANYPKGMPGRGWTVVSSPGELSHTSSPGELSHRKLGLINIAGQVYMENFNNPFHTLDDILAEIQAQTPYILLDFHAEATAEKIAMGWYADGRVSAVVGTHTHVQTADERVLPKGTAYITDVGMTGPYDSVIGTKKEPVIHRFLTMRPIRHEVAKGDVILCAVVIDLDAETGRARSIERIRLPLSEASN